MSLNVGQIYGTINVDDSQFKSAINGANKDMEKLAAVMETARASLIAFFGIQSIGNIGKSLIQAGMDAQNFKTQLEAALQDSTKAAELYGQAIKFAMSTPFGSQESIAAIRDLSLLNFSNVERGLEGIGNLAATFGRNISDITQALFGMETEVFRRLGISINREGKEWSVTFRDKVINVMKGDLQGLREAVAEIGMTEMGGAMEKLAKQLTGAWRQFGDQIDGVKREIMDTGGVTDYLTATVQKVTKEFEAWRESEEGIASLRAIAMDLKDAIDAGVTVVRGFGNVLTFAAENADLLKTALIGIAGAKGISIVADQYKKLRDSISITMAHTEALIENEARSAQAKRNVEAATHGLAAGLDEVSLAEKIAENNADELMAAQMRLNAAMSELQLTMTTSNPFKGLEEGVDGANRAMQLYATKFSSVKDAMNAGMVETEKYIATQQRLMEVQEQLAAESIKLNSMYGTYGNDERIAQQEALINSLKSEQAQLEKNAATYWSNATAKQSALAVDIAAISAAIESVAANEAEVTSILQENGMLSKHITLTEADTAAIMKRVAALQEESGASAMSTAAAGANALKVALGGVAAQIAKFVKTNVVFALIAANIAVWSRNLKLLTKQLEDARIASEGLTFKASQSEEERLAEINRKLSALADRREELESIWARMASGKFGVLATVWRDHSDNLLNLEAQMSMLKAQENEIKYEIKLREKQKKALDAEAEARKKVTEATAKEVEEYKKLTDIPIITDVNKAMSDFNTVVTSIANNTRAAWDKAKIAADQQGVAFENIGREIEQSGTEKIKEYLKEIGKTPGMAELAKKKLVELASLDLSGMTAKLVEGILNGSEELDKMLEKFSDLQEYMNEPPEKFIPILEEMRKKTTPLSDDWKKITNAIKTAEDAQKDYFDELNKRRAGIGDDLAEMYKKGQISAKTYQQEAQKSLDASRKLIEQEIMEMAKNTDVSEEYIYGKIQNRLKEEAERLGLSVKEVDGKLKGIFAEGQKTSSSYYEKYIGSTGKIISNSKEIHDWQNEIVKKIDEQNKGLEKQQKELARVAEESKTEVKAVQAPEGLQLTAQTADDDFKKITESVTSIKSETESFGAVLKESTAIAAENFSKMLESVKTIKDLYGDGLIVDAPTLGGNGSSNGQDGGVSPSVAFPEFSGIFDESVNTMQELIRSNHELTERVRTLETAIRDKDMTSRNITVKQDIDITTTQAAETIKSQAQGAMNFAMGISD
jgi:hypothetical protein